MHSGRRFVVPNSVISNMVEDVSKCVEDWHCQTSLVPPPCMFPLFDTPRAQNTKLVQAIIIASSSAMLEQTRHVTSRVDMTEQVVSCCVS